MTSVIVRFRFAQDIPFDEVQVSLRLARMAVEGLFGIARVRLEALTRVDAENYCVTIVERRDPSRALVRIFTHFLIREFGEQKFQIEQVRPQACSAIRS